MTEGEMYGSDGKGMRIFSPGKSENASNVMETGGVCCAPKVCAKTKAFGDLIEKKWLNLNSPSEGEKNGAYIIQFGSR